MPALANRRSHRRLKKAFKQKTGQAKAKGKGGPGTAYSPSKPGKGKKPKPKPPKPVNVPSMIPGQTGIKAPTIQPFMTAEDMLARAAAEAQYSQQLSDTDFNLAQRQSATDYEKSEIERGRVRDVANVDESMSGRGLFRSSIRDADLFDIDATAAIRKNFLDRELDTATLDAQNTKINAQKAWDSFQGGLFHQMLENAREAGEGMPEWLREPVAARPNPEHQAAQAQFLQQWQQYLNQKNKKPKGKGKGGRGGRGQGGGGRGQGKKKFKRKTGRVRGY